MLPEHGVRVLASSSTYDTEPVGEVLDQPEFLNAVIRIETDLDPEALLDACKAVERELGRQAGGVRHGPRPIDVDLLLLGDLTYSSDRLTLPHAQVTARRFVLVPLLELDPDVTLPDGTRAADATPGRRRGASLRRTTQPVARRPARARGSPGTTAARDRRRAASPRRPPRRPP